MVLRNKTARKLAVRIPRWVDKRTVKAALNEKPVPTHWLGNYLVFDTALQNSDVLTIDFPMVEQTVTSTYQYDKTYTCHFKGNTLVDIAPRDDNPIGYPIYLRDHYKQDKAPLRRVIRFVTPRVVKW